ncbi:MAG TPA: CsgG/HfaB family protein [bacterium]|nr:CsgG/HfaB family protein [bacterium]HPN44495.1 CsgG/HfaB family protein [bacterium]
MKTMRVSLVILILFVSQSFLYAQNKTKIAVLNFEAKNLSQESADAVADILSTELFNTNRFDVIERQAILRILSEQELQMTGVTDMSQAAEIGKILNAEKIMIGSVSRLGQTYIINTRLVDVETGALELAENTKSNNGEDGLPAAIGELVAKISQKVIVEGAVIKVAQNVVLIDLGADHGIKKDQALEVIRVGDVITDLAGSTVGRSEDRIGIIKVINVKKEYAEAQILNARETIRLGDKVRLTGTPVSIKKETTVNKPVEPKPQKDDKKAPVEAPPVF